MSAENPRPFLVEGADGPIVIPEGRYFRNAKAHPEWLQRKRLSAHARMVYACLELATIAFSREKAMKGSNGDAPLTNGDIVRRTGLSKQHVRSALVELEDAGLAERRQVNPELPLQNGNIVICAWAEPHAPKSDGERKGSRAQLPFPDWVPESWENIKPIVRRFKLTLAPDLPLEKEAARDYLQRVSAIARSYLDLEKELARELERVCAQPNSAGIKKETERNTTERNIEASSSSSALFAVPPGTTTTPPAAEPETPAPPADPLPKTILDTFRACVKHKKFSQRTARELVAKARRFAAERGEPLSDEEIVECIREGWECAGRKVSVIGFYNEALFEKLEELLERREGERDDAADRAKEPTAPAGFNEACLARIGTGTFNSFCEVTGNPNATYEEWEEARHALEAEFGLDDWIEKAKGA